MDEGEAALQNISCVMDGTRQSGGKQIKLNYPVDVQKVVFFPPLPPRLVPNVVSSQSFAVPYDSRR